MILPIFDDFNQEIFTDYYFPIFLEKIKNGLIDKIEIYDVLPDKLKKDFWRTLNLQEGVKHFDYITSITFEESSNIAKIIEDNTKLEYFSLHILVGKYDRIITKGFLNCKNLKSFILISYKINDSELMILNDFLLENQNFQLLQLEDNSLKENMIDYLYQGIKNSKSLTSLKLTFNSIEHSKLFSQALIENDSIKELDLLNTKFNLEIFQSLKKMRHLKILKLGKPLSKYEDLIPSLFEGMDLKILDLDRLPSDKNIGEIILRNLNFKHLNTLKFYYHNKNSEKCESLYNILIENELENLDMEVTYLSQDCFLKILKGVKESKFIKKFTLSLYSFLTVLEKNVLMIENDYNSLQSLEITIGTNVLDYRMENLMGSLQKITSLTSLNLFNNEITEIGALEIANYISENRSLTELFLGDNNINDIGLEYISNSLHDNFTLKKLYLSSNNITDQGLRYLSHLYEKNKTLKAIELDYNEITDEGIALIGEFFENFLYISLSENKITQESIPFIKSRILYNLNLSYLKVVNAYDIDFIILRNHSFINVPYSFLHFHDVHFSFSTQKKRKFSE